MSCQHLTVVCVFMTTCQIASGQLSFSQRLALSRNYPRSMLNQGVLRRPPNGYHYESRRRIRNTYPRNSYTIRYGLSNVVRNNSRGTSSPSPSPSKGGKKIVKKVVKKKKKKKKSGGGEDEGGTPDDTSPSEDTSPSANVPPAEDPPAESPPAESPPT